MRKVLVLFALWLSACAQQPKSETVIVPKTAPEEAGRAPIGQMLKAKAVRVEFIENELANLVSAYVAQNPRADYDDVAKYANKQLREVGFAFDLISLDAEPFGSETLVKTVGGQWLNVGMFWEPLCAEGIAARYPVVAFKGGLWTVKYKAGTFQIRAKTVRTGEILRTKDGKRIGEVPLPEEGFEPGGIKSNGSAIFAKLNLNPSANLWWRQSMRRDPKDEPPFLVLHIGKDYLEFSTKEEDLDLYEHKPIRKTEEDDSYQINFPDAKYAFRSQVCT